MNPIKVFISVTLLLGLGMLTLASTDKIKELATETTKPTSLFAQLGTYAWNIFCIVGPILQYAPVISNVHTLSPYVIAILMISNVIRIFYWFADPFEIPLVLQSAVMIVMQYLLLQALTQYLTRKVKDGKKLLVENGEKSDEKIQIVKKLTLFNSPLNLSTFWQWTEIQSYSIVLSVIVSVLVFGHVTFGEYVWYGKFLGFLGLLIESMLGVPQVVKNVKNGTTDLSPILFLTWLAGDLAKTVAFFGTGAPLPFILCGIVQIITDIVIILQIVIGNYFTKDGKKAE
jgi:hypothetical protein